MPITEITENKPLVEDVLGSRARVKIIKALAFDEELTISLLVRKTRLNYVIAMKHLKV